MDFELSDRCRDFQERLGAFMDERVYPAEHVYEQQLREAGDPHAQPAIMEELKAEARERGLWNLFHPDPQWGPGLSNVEYAPLAEMLGRSHIGSEACNCSAPDTGNMEVLSLFGSGEQQDRWLRPLLDGEIRSTFAMTEPDVASSDATNIRLSITREGDEWVLNGRKWWASGALHPHCAVLIVMGRTAAGSDAPPYKQQSMVLVPIDTPGLEVVRGLPVFGYQDQEGHAELHFQDVRVPAENLIAGEGDGFMIGQRGSRAHPPLHALAGRRRASAGAALPAGHAARDLRPARGHARQRAGLGRRGAHRDRDAAPAGLQDGLAHGYGGQSPRPHGDRRHQGGGPQRRPEDHRPRHPGARGRRRL